MHAAKGILTARGGMTSHAAVVARGMGRPCVSGAGGLSIDAKNCVLNVRGRRLVEGDVITIDGASGEVMAGEGPPVYPALAGEFGKIMEWAGKRDWRELGMERVGRVERTTGGDGSIHK